MDRSIQTRATFTVAEEEGFEMAKHKKQITANMVRRGVRTGTAATGYNPGHAGQLGIGGRQGPKDCRGVVVLVDEFQTGVGGMPITFEISKDNPTVKEWLERKDRVERWLKIGIAENEMYEREIQRFKAKQ
jgi:hypothetical protein